MVFFPGVLLKLADRLLCQLLPNYCHRAARKFRNYGGLFLRNPPPKPQTFPSITKLALEARSDCPESATLVCDIAGALLRSCLFFPYFMLVAFEAGGIMRALLLLLSSPILLLLDYKAKLRIMIFVTFCGLRVRDVESVARAVLPKFYLEDLNKQAYDVLASARGKVVITSVPRVMVEGFLKEFLGVDKVIGTELHSTGKYFTGLISAPGLVSKHRALKDYFGERRPDIGLGSSRDLNDYLFMSLCKEAYLVNKEEQSKNSNGAAFSGLKITAKGCKNEIRSDSPEGGGILYVCTHRTLLDPVFLSTSMAQSVTAVTYSLSTVSEFISPIRTVRLTRDRARDGETMKKLLSEGDLVICPEGTTCREPYLLRFSSLFAELAHEIVPVAVNTEVSMFYGTTARGLKCLDPIFFLMNPRPTYYVNVLGKVPRELTCEGGRSRHEVANGIQKQLADALGFECTGLTRRDKYLMLAGNEGVVEEPKKRDSANRKE
ncbi:glycerol-3-phosphate acyltransferase 1-like isoform X2 [Punica granatum]|uniref:Glycerol-3-phosphate acyltransferase 1-like isoform X2 n=1 Tax=Punica granatum TaxID=22663 RepID=A0A6P8D2G7_PUNGR|nr:glycerol-3-phosphate acyltransferase 1-like isoform X2 [Punica granatum]